jgi:hypothetical protein
MSIDLRTKPVGNQIRVSLDSGANTYSEHYDIVEVQDLGFDSKGAWDAASDDEKLKAVQEYWYDQGYPEWGWDEEKSANNK